MGTVTAMQLYQLMFASMKDGLAIVSVDQQEPDASPMTVYINPAALEISGRFTENLNSRRLADYFPGLFRSDLPRSLSRIAREGGLLDLEDVAVGTRFYRIKVFALQENYLGLVFSDVSERKKAKEDLAQLLTMVQKDAADFEKRVAERTAQLEEINTELDSFAYSVSHDLRAPLRAMQGFAGILLEDLTQSETERMEYLKRILSAAQIMDRLVQDLLAYSRLSRQEIVLQNVSLKKVVLEAAQQLELASGGKTYRLDILGELPDVIGHHAVLVQVVLNLLTNGIKFVPKGVTPELRIWADQQGEQCRLFVEDNGIGIAPQHKERIFKVFERLHGIDAYPGTGLGLAIVRKAVTRLGGRIEVESREGEGSRFWIELAKSGE